MDETLDDLFWPLLLLFYVKYTFPFSILFFRRDRRGGINFSVGNVEIKGPEGSFPPASGFLMLVWNEKNFSLPLTVCSSY